MTRSLARAALVLALLLPGTSAFAIPITYRFNVTATDGPLNGVSASGTFTFDSSIIPASGGQVRQPRLFDDFAFTWHGITYDETTANGSLLQFDATGRLTAAGFGNRCSVDGCGGIRPGEEGFTFNGPPFAFPGSFAYAIQGQSAWSGTGSFALVPTVPEPASLTLLASGLVGLVASARRRRSKTA